MFTLWSRSKAIGPARHVFIPGLHWPDSGNAANVHDTPVWFQMTGLHRLLYLQLNTYFSDPCPTLTKAQGFFRIIFLLTEFVEDNIQRVTCSSWSLYCVEPFFSLNLHETFLQWDNYIPFWKTKEIGFGNSLRKTCVVVNRLWNILLFSSSEGYCNYLLLNDNYYNVCKNERIKHNTGIIRNEAIMENVLQTQSED